MVPYSGAGLAAPIHVQSHKKMQIQMCSNQQCCDGMMHSDLVNPAAECIHLKAATCATMAKEIWLTEDALQELHSLQNISKSTQERCIEEQINAWKSSASVVALADFTPYGYNDRMLNFPVFLLEAFRIMQNSCVFA